MALPKLKFTPETIISLAANHGEKLLALIAILFSLPLAWGGVNALRTQMLEQSKSPAAIENAAAEAENQFSRVLAEEQQALLAKRLRGPQVDPVAMLDAWWVDELGGPPTGLGLNRPLLGDIKKRDAPTVCPLEQFQAVAGVAAIAREQEQPPFAGLPGAFEGMGQNLPQVQSPPAKLLPYVILTGLVPVRKQADEFRSLYATASYTDAERDVPRWSDYLIERQEVGNSGDGPWTPISLEQAVGRWRRTWVDVSTEALPAELMLSDTENPRDPTTMPIGFCGPLPELAALPTLEGGDGLGGTAAPPGSVAWGLTGLHPWAVAELAKQKREQEEAQQQQEGGLLGLPFADFGQPGQGMGGGPGFTPFAGGGPPGEAGMYPGFDDPMMGPDGMVNQLDYRLFRFLDTAVEPGKAYRYRVTLRLWNPNVGLPIKYLEDPSLAEAVTLASEPADLQAAAKGRLLQVPGLSQVLTRLLSRSDKKLAGLGGNDNEALVLDANPDSGNFELHSAEIKLGQPVEVEEAARRLRIGNQRISVPEHDVETDLTVLGLVGEQELDDKKRIARGFVPPPPFELLLVNAEGGIIRVTPSDSAPVVKQYLQTLPGYTPPQQPYAMQPEFR